MKRNIKHILMLIMVTVTATSYATVHDVTVTDAAFSPSSFNANIGDTVLWSFSSGNYYQNNTASTSVPSGAATWSSGPLSAGGSFMYVITTAGTYNYNSTAWDPFSASFTVSAPAPPAHSLHTVTVTDAAFIPSSFNANIGDTVLWSFSSGNSYQNNTASTSVPTGATGWSSGPESAGASFMYIVTTAGTYNYNSTAWDAFSGSFTVGGIAPPPAHASHNVIISDYAFSPDTFTAQVGDTVVWTTAGSNLWTDNSASTTIPTAALPWSSPGLQPNQSFMYIISTPGVYNYQSDSFYTFTASFTVPGPVSKTHLVLVTDNYFAPDSFNANIGDTVTWLATAGNQWLVNSASITIPEGAAPWTSGGLNPGQSFSYTITTNGDYSYQSDSFYTLSAKFTVGSVATGLGDVTGVATKLIFQNPFAASLNILSTQTGTVNIYDAMGRMVATAKLDFAGYPVEINMQGLNAGVYFIALLNNDKLIQTYKAVKVN